MQPSPIRMAGKLSFPPIIIALKVLVRETGKSKRENSLPLRHLIITGAGSPYRLKFYSWSLSIAGKSLEKVAWELVWLWFGVLSRIIKLILMCQTNPMKARPFHIPDGRWKNGSTKPSVGFYQLFYGQRSVHFGRWQHQKKIDIAISILKMINYRPVSVPSGKKAIAFIRANRLTWSFWTW